MDIIGIVPARGGSKGIPRKNLASVAGKPLIQWTIEAGRRAPSLARVLVSTDDEEIASVSRRLGADVPFMRPAALAADDTSSVEVVAHAIQWLEEHERRVPTYVLLLQPTCPLRTEADIEAAVAIARQKNADSVIGVCRSHDHPLWTKQIREDGTLVDYMSGAATYTRRQDLPAVYALNGAIYLVRSHIVTHHRSFHTDKSYPCVMPAERSLDVDSAWDLRLADLLLRDAAAARSSAAAV